MGARNDGDGFVMTERGSTKNSVFLRCRKASF